MQPVIVPEWFHSRVGKVTGAGVQVCIVDSGFESIAGDGPVSVISVDFTRPQRRSLGMQSNDLIGHGTACLTTAYRLAPGASFASVRVFHHLLYTSVSEICRALVWATERNADVVNLSLHADPRDPRIRDLYSACETACARGVVIVAASEGAPCYPASFDNVIAVGRGSQRNPFEFDYRRDSLVEITASCGIDGYVVGRSGEELPADGVSYCAPVVSGLVALLRERYPGMPLTDIRCVLEGISRNHRFAA